MTAIPIPDTCSYAIFINKCSTVIVWMPMITT